MESVLIVSGREWTVAMLLSIGYFKPDKKLPNMKNYAVWRRAKEATSRVK